MSAPSSSDNSLLLMGAAIAELEGDVRRVEGRLLAIEQQEGVARFLGELDLEEFRAMRNAIEILQAQVRSLQLAQPQGLQALSMPRGGVIAASKPVFIQDLDRDHTKEPA